MDKVKVYVRSILLPVVVGLVVGGFTSQFIAYNDLVKPVWAPPGFLFPIVWTILYVLMGVSFGILESNSLITKEIESVYYVQLVVNALWPVFFFVFEVRFFAFVWIMLLAVLVINMIRRFYDKNKLAGLLQIPYFVWVIFATFLNYAIFLLNRGV